MKKVFLLLLLLAASFLPACQKAPINGDLDGMWQLMSIQYQDQSVKNPEQLYYCIQLHMVQLQGAAFCSGTFDHSGDSVRMVMRESSAEAVAPYGMNDTIQSFFIEGVSSEKMVLKSSSARLSFRKF